MLASGMAAITSTLVALLSPMTITAYSDFHGSTGFFEIPWRDLASDRYVPASEGADLSAKSGLIPG